MAAEWRLLELPVLDAADNMALDRAIQLAHARGESPPTLRLYEWRRPTATLGKFQEAECVDADICLSRGVDVVRRFTGGRGVLHDDELTYAVIAGERDQIPRGVSASYRHLCMALAEAYRSLGVPAALNTRDRGVKGSAACYLHSTKADLSVGLAKLSGSAQVWHESTVLQHGSFVISRDLGLEAGIFRLAVGDAAELQARTVTLSDYGDAQVYRDTVRGAVRDAFERSLDVSLKPGACSKSELETMRELREDVLVDLSV